MKLRLMLFAPVLALVACGTAPRAVEDPNTTLMADFRLIDVNTASPTFNAERSPSNYAGEISAWYFGAST